MNYSKFPNYVSFIRNSTRYVCFLEDEFAALNEGVQSNILYKIDKDGIIQIDNFDEIDFFVGQLDRLLDEVKVKKADSLNMMKSMLNSYKLNGFNKKKVSDYKI